MDRYGIMTMIISALLSTYAFVAANQKPEIQYIDFEDKPLIITSSINK